MILYSFFDTKPEILEVVTKALKRGKVVAHATDTCYGLACDAWNKQAICRLAAIKGMEASRPVSLICANAKQAFEYGEFSEEAKGLARKYWPGGLTIIVRKKAGVFEDFFNPNTDTVGLRVPKDARSLALLKAFGKPLSSTSANVSGEAPSYSAAKVKASFSEQEEEPDILLDSGELDITVEPSTIIDCSGPSPILKRRGSVRVKI